MHLPLWKVLKICANQCHTAQYHTPTSMLDFTLQTGLLRTTLSKFSSATVDTLRKFF
jgi:hypothetical protein